MKRYLLLLCMSFISAGEYYEVIGTMAKVDAFVYQDSLVLRHVPNMTITAQPRLSQLSYLSDVSEDGLILSLKPNTSYMVSAIDGGYQIYSLENYLI